MFTCTLLGFKQWECFRAEKAAGAVVSAGVNAAENAAKSVAVKAVSKVEDRKQSPVSGRRALQSSAQGALLHRL